MLYLSNGTTILSVNVTKGVLIASMNNCLLSSKKMDWCTPDYIFDELDLEFHFDLDPCATPENAKCDLFYTVDDDGLKQSWIGHSVFCNPPYGRSIKKWVNHAVLSTLYNDDTTVVMLLPARTDTSYFHDLILPFARDIRFLRGRITFVGASTPAPFPSMIVVFGGKKL